mgnify:CR=1 FL=1
MSAPPLPSHGPPQPLLPPTGLGLNTSVLVSSSASSTSSAPTTSNSNSGGSLRARVQSILSSLQQLDKRYLQPDGSYPADVVPVIIALQSQLVALQNEAKAREAAARARDALPTANPAAPGNGAAAAAPRSSAASAAAAAAAVAAIPTLFATSRPHSRSPPLPGSPPPRFPPPPLGSAAPFCTAPVPGRGGRGGSGDVCTQDSYVKPGLQQPQPYQPYQLPPQTYGGAQLPSSYQNYNPSYSSKSTASADPHGQRQGQSQDREPAALRHRHRPVAPAPPLQPSALSRSRSRSRSPGYGGAAGGVAGDSGGGGGGVRRLAATSAAVQKDIASTLHAITSQLASLRNNDNASHGCRSPGAGERPRPPWVPPLGALSSQHADTARQGAASARCPYSPSSSSRALASPRNARPGLAGYTDGHGPAGACPHGAACAYCGINAAAAAALGGAPGFGYVHVAPPGARGDGAELGGTGSQAVTLCPVVSPRRPAAPGTATVGTSPRPGAGAGMSPRRPGSPLPAGFTPHSHGASPVRRDAHANCAHGTHGQSVAVGTSPFATPRRPASAAATARPGAASPFATPRKPVAPAASAAPGQCAACGAARADGADGDGYDGAAGHPGAGHCSQCGYCAGVPRARPPAAALAPGQALPPGRGCRCECGCHAAACRAAGGCVFATAPPVSNGASDDAALLASPLVQWAVKAPAAGPACGACAADPACGATAGDDVPLSAPQTAALRRALRAALAGKATAEQAAARAQAQLQSGANSGNNNGLGYGGDTAMNVLLQLAEGGGGGGSQTARSRPMPVTEAEKDEEIAYLRLQVDEGIDAVTALQRRLYTAQADANRARAKAASVEGNVDKDKWALLARIDELEEEKRLLEEGMRLLRFTADTAATDAENEADLGRLLRTDLAASKANVGAMHEHMARLQKELRADVARSGREKLKMACAKYLSVWYRDRYRTGLAALADGAGVRDRVMREGLDTVFRDGDASGYQSARGDKDKDTGRVPADTLRTAQAEITRLEVRNVAVSFLTFSRFYLSNIHILILNLMHILLFHSLCYCAFPLRPHCSTARSFCARRAMRRRSSRPRLPQRRMRHLGPRPTLSFLVRP